MEDNFDSSRFLHSIDKYARKRKMKITEEIKKIEHEKLSQEEAKIVESAKLLMMSELSGVKSEISFKIYNAKSDAFRAVSKKKMEIEDNIFDLCKDKLIKFTKSDKYFNKLVDLVNFISKAEKGELEVFVREEDAIHVEKLQKKFPLCAFKFDKRIKLGGLMFKNGNKIMDNTFDSGLKLQKKWFFENCYNRIN